MKDYAVTDKDTICYYFQCLQGTGKKRVIDPGCFLKRIGALSRTALDLTIPEDAVLTGVDITEAPDLPIYTKIYDVILKELPEEHFDIGIFLCPKGVYSEEEIRKITSWGKNHCDRFITGTGRPV